MMWKRLLRIRWALLAVFLVALLIGGAWFITNKVGENFAEQETQGSGSEPEPELDLTPVQTDSPVDAFYTKVPRPSITLAEIPPYSGNAWVKLNDGKPFLEGDEMEEIQILLTPLDSLERCGAVMMLAGPETLPTAERRSISAIHPSGWVQKQYPELINDAEGRIYRRCHMLMFAFSGLNATEENLMTGTDHFNKNAMGGWETQVLEYIRSTGHHVLYRCTPFFDGDDLLARGLLVEALSLEDDEIDICVYCYNVQPGIELDYATGDSHVAEGSSRSIEADPSEDAAADAEEARDYVLNVRSKKIHLPDCQSVQEMKEENKKEVHCTRQELIDQGYDPCGNCNP